MWIPHISIAQNDSLSKPPIHSPKTATILSAIIPGGGQIYNKQYWKVPIVYAGFASLTYIAIQNNIFYSDYKSVYDSYQNYYKTEIAEGRSPKTDTLLLVRNQHLFSVHNVKAGRDFYRRRRDLALIGIGGVYILQMIEAYVSAHMFSFDISDDLSVKYQPTFFYSHQVHAGIRVSVHF